MDARAKKALDTIADTKSEPAETCKEDYMHDYKVIAHMDGKKHFYYVYKCEHCDDLVKRKYLRDEPQLFYP